MAPLATSLLLVLLLTVPSACTTEARERGHDGAAKVFAAFQDALLRGDRQALWHLVTRESRPAIEHLPLDRAAGKEPLRIVSTLRGDEPSQTLVHATDPNEGGRPATFVLSLEEGELRVDLLATSAHHATEKWLPGPRERVVQRPLTPREMATFFSRVENERR